MTLPGNLTGPRRRMGAIRAAKCIEVYQDEHTGQYMADILTASGGIYLGCRIQGMGGGGPDDDNVSLPTTGAWSGSPEDLHGGECAEVWISFPDGPSPHPVIIGTAPNPKAARRLGGTNKGRTSPSSKTGVRERSSGANGARTLYTEDGSMALDVARRDGSVHVVLGESGALKLGHVSYDEAGEPSELYASGERVLLGNATLAVLQAMSAKIGELTVAVNALISQASAAPVAPLSPLPTGALLSESVELPNKGALE